MRLGRIILALFLATIAGSIVVLWPQSPLWTQSIHPRHELAQYSQDGKSLIIADGWSTNSPPSDAPALVYFDLKTGQVTKRVPLTFTEKTFVNRFWLTPDAQTILAEVSTAVKENNGAYYGPRSLVAFDVATSKVLRGPWSCDRTQSLEFSRDRQWYCYSKSDGEISELELSITKDYSNLKSHLHIASASDFRDVLSIPFNPSEQAFHEVCFFDDEPKIAVLYTKWPGKPLMELAKESPERLQQLQQVLEIWDLKLGKMTISTQLPASHRWSRPVSAVNHTIYVKGQVNEANVSENVTEVARVSLVEKGEVMISFEPLLSSSSRSSTTRIAGFTTLVEYRHCISFGDDWVCHAILHDRDKIAGWFVDVISWIDAKCRTHLIDYVHPRLTVSVKDCRSGQKRLDISVADGPQLLISPDGRYLATPSYTTRTLELWNANPTRWPYALSTSLLTLFLLLLEKRQRSNSIPLLAGGMDNGDGTPTHIKPV